MSIENDSYLRASLTDYTKHLRSIHFTLAVACLAILATISLQVTDYEEALFDLEGITTFQGVSRQSVDWYPNFVERTIDFSKRESYEQSRDASDISLYTVSYIPRAVKLEYFFEEKKVTRRLFVKPAQWTAYQREANITEISSHINSSVGIEIISSTDLNNATAPPMIELPAIDTLGDFAVTWDELIDSYACIEAGLAYNESVILDGYSMKLIDANPKFEDDGEPIHIRGANYDLPLVLMPSRFIGDGKTPPRELKTDTGYVYVNRAMIEYQSQDGDYETVDHLVAIPVLCGKVPLNVHTEIARLAQKPLWRTGLRFSESFPKLHSLTKNLAGLKVEDIKAVLQSERERIGENFELLGVKLPLKLLNQWGIFLLLSIQIYLVLHLSAFCRLLTSADEVWSAPWVALYPEKLSRLVTLATTAVLPTSVVAILVVGSASRSSFAGAISIAALLGSIFASCAVILKFRRIWMLSSTK